MLIHCTKCGRKLAEIDPPSFQPAEANAVRRILGAKLFGFDLSGMTSSIDAILNPSPVNIAQTFNARCPGQCPWENPPAPGLGG